MMDRRWKVLLLVSVGNFITFLDLFIVNVAFPDISRSFPDASLASLSWVLNAYTILLAALLVPAGRWADLVGRKRVFITGLAVFVLASAISAAAPSVGVLIGGRAVQAIGAAMIIPSSLGLILPEFSDAERMTAVGAWAAVGAVAAAAGPPIGGLLVEISWHWVFLINVPIGLAAIGGSARLLQERRDPEAGPNPDILGAATLAVGIGALVLSIVQGPDWGWSSPRVLAGFATAALLLPLTLVRSARHPAPVVELSILRVRSFSLAGAALLVFSAGFAAFLLGGVLFLTGVWRYSVLEAGLALAPAPVTAAFAAATAKNLEERFGQRMIAAAGALTYAAGSGWLAVAITTEANYLVDALPALILAGIGAGLAMPAMMTMAVSSLPAQRLATGTGVMVMARQIGSALGVAILVAILGSVTAIASAESFDKGWTFVVAAAVTSALIVLLVGAQSESTQSSRISSAVLSDPQASE